MNWLFLPPCPLYLLTLVWLLLLVLATIRYRRERSVCRQRIALATLILRATGLTILYLIALNPTAFRERKSAGKPKLMVLLDTSASMQVRDCGANTRLEAAKQALKKASNAIERDFDAMYFLYDADLRPGTPDSADGTGKASDHARAILSGAETVAPATAQDTKKNDRTGAVLLLSDGRSTTRGAATAARFALARSVPVWTVAFGGSVERRDLRITLDANEVPAFAEEEVELHAQLHQQGYPNRSFRVEFLKGDLVAQILEATPDTHGVAQMRVRVKAPASGEERYAFRVNAEVDETDAGNNEYPVFIRSGARKARVLLAEGQPHWDSKFLVQFLKRDERVEVTALFRLGKNRTFALLPEAKGELREKEGAFPDTAEKFSRFDVVMIGRDAESFLPPESAALLSGFVADGGTLIFTRGKSSGSTFSKLEPMIFDNGAAGIRAIHALAPSVAAGIFPAPAESETPTNAAQPNKHRQTLPGLDRVQTVVGLKPLAQALAAAGDTPVLAWQRYGQGRVCQLNMGGLWRWGFREDEKAERAYADFWRGLLRWLLSGESFRAGETVALFCERRICSEEECARFVIRTRNLEIASYHPRMTIEPISTGAEVSAKIASDFVPAQLSPGVFSLNAPLLPPGAYRAVLYNNIGTPAQIPLNFRVVPSSVENQNLSADPAQLEQIAQISGAQTLQPADLDKLGEYYSHYSAGRTLGEDRICLWDRWWILTSAALLFGIEFFLRRREGLL